MSEKSIFQNNLEHARAARRATANNKSHEKAEFFDKGRPWHYFTRDVEDYISTIERKFPGFSEYFYHRLEEKKENGESALIIDLAGAAGGETLDAETISITLSTSVADTATGKTLSLQPQAGQTVLEGDLLSHKIQKELIEQVRSTGKAISFVFFLPFGGAAPYHHNLYALRKFERLIVSVYDALEPGGEILLDFSLLDRESVSAINEVLSRFGETSQNGKSFRVRKTETITGSNGNT